VQAAQQAHPKWGDLYTFKARIKEQKHTGAAKVALARRYWLSVGTWYKETSRLWLVSPNLEAVWTRSDRHTTRDAL